VLTSLYNCEAFLSDFLKALSQIEGQEQIEVLLLHNAPTKNELALINHHLPTLNFVRHIIIPERETLYRTWNRGIELSAGEYITIWNVDDVRFPRSILQQAQALDNNPQASMAYGDIWLSDQYGVQGAKKTDSPIDNRRTHKKFLSGYYASCFQMWRKSVHSVIGYYDEQFKCVADFDFQIRLALRYSLVKVSEPLGIYFENRPDKLSHNGLQELENNIVYLRYGVYEKVNLFSDKLSRTQYRKDEFLFFDAWHPVQEPKSFSFLHRAIGWNICIIKSTLKHIKINLMKPFFKRLYKTSVAYGFDPKKLRNTLQSSRNRAFRADMQEFLRQKGSDPTFRWGTLYPTLSEGGEEGGTMKGAYFHGDLHVAQQIFEAHPQKHLDIGSRTDGFVAHVASFREIELIDIRPIHTQVKNICFRQADLMNLPEDMLDYCDSISSLHVLEHFGLGRYGDPIDYLGHLKGIENITKILKKGGTFYFSVPMGPQRIEFNEQRVFSLSYLIQILSVNYTIHAFSYVNDKGDLIKNATLTDSAVQSDFSCWYGCAIFTLIKK
jgi:SAM-dependent methyltransferase